MGLSGLEKKAFETSRGFTYTYYTSLAKDGRPTLILFHGWPDNARLWTGLINDYLVPHGYGVVAIDCLGYGDSSKPTDPKEYAWNKMTADAIEILDAERISQVISVGHDWGSVMCQRLYNFYPSRVHGVILVNVPYMPPTGQSFDLDQANKMTEDIFGHGLYSYWYLLAADDGAAIMNKNPESVYAAAFGDPASWLAIWCSPDGIRKFVTEGQTQPTLSFATDEHKREFMTRMSDENGGFAPSLCWYRACTQNIQPEAEKLVADEAKVLNVPVLYWGGDGDSVCRPAMLQPSIDAGLVPNVKSVVRQGGHWALLEKPAEFGQDVAGWLKETYT